MVSKGLAFKYIFICTQSMFFLFTFFLYSVDSLNFLKSALSQHFKLSLASAMPEYMKNMFL